MSARSEFMKRLAENASNVGLEWSPNLTQKAEIFSLGGRKAEKKAKALEEMARRLEEDNEFAHSFVERKWNRGDELKLAKEELESARFPLQKKEIQSAIDDLFEEASDNLSSHIDSMRTKASMERLKSNIIKNDLAKKTGQTIKAVAPVAAMPGFQDPTDLIGEGVGMYEDAKQAIARKLADQMNFGRNPQDTENMADMLSFAGDPINAVPGAAGVGLGLLQGAGEFKRKRRP